jgi:putative flippase GtrA
VVNSATLFLAVRGASLGLASAKLLAAACTFATNFTLRRQFLFSQPRTP